MEVSVAPTMNEAVYTSKKATTEVRTASAATNNEAATMSKEAIMEVII